VKRRRRAHSGVSVTCSWCEERFERFLDGHVSDAERARLLGHVDSCAPCSGLLEELRVVDGLLIEARTIELPPDFTSATMAEVHALPEPAACPQPVVAWLVSFLVAAWCLIGAASLIMPAAVLTFATGALNIARDVLFAFGGVGRVIAHLPGRANPGSWTVAAGSVVVADALVLVALVAAVRILQPRIAERLRW
jgi:hypothetical protein